MSALKWVGGKRQLLRELENKFPKKIKNFYEPFGGSLTVTLYVLENLECERIFVSDINTKLINFFNKTIDNVELLIKHIKIYKDNDYYECRNLFNENQSDNSIEEAALFFYLNKKCFNGIYRVNKHGGYNVPIGRNSVNWENNFNNLRNFSNKIKSNKITIENLNYKKFFEKYTESISEDDLVYIDPPYYDTFVSYDGYGFSEDDQVTLCDTCSKLNCTVIASNSNTEFTRNLYTKNNFNIEEINAYRFINRNGQDRNKKPVEIICVKKTSET